MNHGENVNITFVTYPHKDKDKFPEKIDEFYKKYKESADKYSKDDFPDHLFSPLKYHLFSNYDLAVISITDSEKFAQKIFAPDISEEHTNRSTYQIITGITKQICKDSDFDLSNTLKELTSVNCKKNLSREGKYKYALFINLCINKGLLIGCGTKLEDQFCDEIDSKIRNRLNLENDKKKVTNRYLLSKSYSWFDLSIVIFSDNPQELIDALLDIRNIKFKDLIALNNDKVILDCEETLYHVFYNAEINCDKIKELHLVTETSSILGVEYYKYLNQTAFNNDKLNTQIEWKIKPGYEREFCKAIRSIDNGDFCDKENFFFTNGKMDYVFEETKKEFIESNLIVFSNLRDTSAEGLTKYVKSVKTKTLFNNKKWFDERQDNEPQDNSELPDTNDVPDITKSLERLTFKKADITNIKESLRSSKISRQLRNKIIKCFYLTNNGLTDRVLFNFYIDFIPFLKRLYHFIIDPEKKYVKLQKYEDVLIKYVIAFDRAYKNRTFNSYLFEDIHEYSIDYNAALQQLLSNYNTCVHILTRSYNEKNTKMYQETPRFLVNINLNNTVSNPVNINFHVHDLTAPELVFCLLHKEIINEYIKLRKIKSTIKLPKNFKKSFSFSDTNDIYNDCLRVILTFNFDFGLYSFWFWSFNIQNTQLYNQNGFINEEHFAHELIRFLSVKLIFNNFTLDKCPIPELFIYWDRYYDKLYNQLKEQFDLKIVHAIQDNLNRDLTKIFINDHEPFEDLKTKFKTEWKIPLTKDKPNFKVDRIWEHRYEWLCLCSDRCIKGKTDKNSKAIEKGIDKVYSDIKNSEINKITEYNESKEIIRQKHSILLESIIFCFLKLMQISQNNQISILRRNLTTGEPLSSFIKNTNDDSFYCLDPQGGHFNIDTEKREEYFKIRNNMMDIIWDISLKWKKDYIVEHLNKN